ncbi:hypothetical protein GCM10009001_29830 [Virgibacillus siamensis]|uniref:PepSY domain-containing protein n=1 Tax=Virgibacillus siamensis TaxID=480071 RepID=A0ABP3RH80_9BACI
MKKKVGFILSILLGLSALGLGMYHTSASQAAPKLSMEQIKDQIQKQYPGKITEFELDKEGKRAVYEVEVVQDGKEYDIVFDGNTGDVLSLEKQSVNKADSDEKDDDRFDKDDDKNENDDADDEEYDRDDRDDNVKEKNDDKKNASKDDEPSKEPRVSAAKAQKIALKEVSGTVISSELDEDDDRLIYEIEVQSDKKEAEFDIDAYTGEIIVMSIDTDENDSADDTNSNSNNRDDDRGDSHDEGNNQDDASDANNE